jgi:DNA-binding transcriptional LysR family regulator
MADGWNFDISDTSLLLPRKAASPRPLKGASVGFLTGQEVVWLPHVTHILQSQLKDIDFRVTSDFSPHIAQAGQRGEIDLGLSRIERQSDVIYKVIAREPIVAVLLSDHFLAARSEIDRTIWIRTPSSDTRTRLMSCVAWFTSVCATEA